MYWREFIIYLMQDLDDREIEELKKKLNDREKKIPQTVEQLLLNAHIPVGKNVLAEQTNSTCVARPYESI